MTPDDSRYLTWLRTTVPELDDPISRLNVGDFTHVLYTQNLAILRHPDGSKSITKNGRTLSTFHPQLPTTC